MMMNNGDETYNGDDESKVLPVFPIMFFFGIQKTILFLSFIWTLPAGGCGVMTPGFWQVGVPQPMPG